MICAKWFHHIELRINQFILSNHIALFLDNNEILHIFDKTSIIMHYYDLILSIIFHLKYIFDFIQAIVSSYLYIFNLIYFEFIIYNYYNINIQIKSIDIDLNRFEIILDLLSIKFNQD